PPPLPAASCARAAAPGAPPGRSAPAGAPSPPSVGSRGSDVACPGVGRLAPSSRPRARPGSPRSGSSGHPSHPPTEHMPVQMENRLPASGADVDDDAVVLEAHLECGLGDELEHPLRLVGRELGDVSKRFYVAFRNDEQMRLRAWGDVRDRNEAFALPDMVA